MDLETVDDHFHDIENVDDVPLNRSVLHLLAKNSQLKAEELELGYQKSSLYPTSQEWLNIAYRFFLGVGLLLFLSGIIFFFAYNWDSLHKFAKLGLIQLGILSIGIPLIVTKPSDFVIKLGLTAISVLVGIAFAVFGQIYQTGADAYDFFLGWSVFVTAWVAIAAFPFLWFFYLVLINITIVLYLVQVQMYTHEEVLSLIIAFINTIALCLWEYAIKGDRSDWVHALLTRMIGAVVVITLTIGMIWVIFDFRAAVDLSVINIVFYLGVLIGGSWYYIKKGKDIGFTTMLALSVLVIGNAWIISLVDHNFNEGIFLLLSIGNLGATVFLVMKLVQIKKRWEQIAKETSSPYNQLDHEA
ncbi:DUF2157 domain-containing protein [Aureispira sp. CCB-QB1]|uniref:DUF2157 domain-containing protein n=1 Tax=Aureispira sp. CCB-QB1 TaxID=1313421 RepID=UPI0006985619|nr:DUF2157 domain-containing protein [Aureispira sp. CCB-QB1]